MLSKSIYKFKPLRRPICAAAVAERHSSTVNFPVVDLSKSETEISKDIYNAMTSLGAFVVVGSNISDNLQKETLDAAKNFFNLPVDDKELLHVRKGGIAWRGWMPFGGEYTHGRLDEKEGLYLGPEHADPPIRCGWTPPSFPAVWSATAEIFSTA